MLLTEYNARSWDAAPKSDIHRSIPETGFVRRHKGPPLRKPASTPACCLAGQLASWLRDRAGYRLVAARPPLSCSPNTTLARGMRRPGLASTDAYPFVRHHKGLCPPPALRSEAQHPAMATPETGSGKPLSPSRCQALDALVFRTPRVPKTDRGRPRLCPASGPPAGERIPEGAVAARAGAEPIPSSLLLRHG